MKIKWMLTGMAVAGLGIAIFANSQEVTPGPLEMTADGAQQTGTVGPFGPGNSQPQPRLSQVQVEFVEMSHEALTKLLFLAKPTSLDATKLREQVHDMVLKNEAKVLETQMVVAISEHKATSESVHEYIYPTEYEPPQFLGSVPGEAEIAPRATSGAVPTAFDTRNLGTSLEVESAVSEDNKIINVRLVSELIWHTGNTTWYEGKDKGGNSFKMEMPNFSVVRLNTSITCINGQYSLAGVLSPKDDKGEVDMTRKLMVFVKCDVLLMK